MAFEAFITKPSSGAFHQRRAIAYAAAACVLVALGIASARVGGGAVEPPPPPKEPDPVDVTLEEKIEEEKPKEEPPPPQPAAIEVPHNVKISAEPPPPVAKEPDPDTKANLEETDPSKDKGVAGGSHEGDPNGAAGGTGSGTVKKDEPPPCGGEGQTCCAGACKGGLECVANMCKKPAPPPPPAPKMSGGQAVAEGDTPAKGVSTPPPAYPEAARAAGTQGTVIVKLTIDEHGKVVSAKIVKGDPNFDAAVMTTVLGWKYEPAKHPDGAPFLSTKTVKIPFKIKG